MKNGKNGVFDIQIPCVTRKKEEKTQFFKIEKNDFQEFKAA